MEQGHRRQCDACLGLICIIGKFMASGISEEIEVCEANWFRQPCSEVQRCVSLKKQEKDGKSVYLSNQNYADRKSGLLAPVSIC